MKINPDCIRDVLLYLEENLAYNHDRQDGIEHNTITMYTIAEDLHNQKGYETDDVNYSVEKLLEIRYIISSGESRGRNNSILYCPISDISYNGHMFLNTIRPKTIWEATKSKAKQIGGMSIHSLSMISSTIMQGLASNSDFIQSIVDAIKENPIS